MDIELNACYQRLGQNESVYHDRIKQEKQSIRERQLRPVFFSRASCRLQGLKTISSSRFMNKCSRGTNKLLKSPLS
jgi:hypothetical protein